jgi:hypothetical protein
LGGVLLGGGRVTEAAARHAAALALAQQAGERLELARAHDGLARAREAAGCAEQARDHWERAAALFAELGLPQAEEACARLGSPAGDRTTSAAGTGQDHPLAGGSTSRLVDGSDGMVSSPKLRGL